MARSHARIATLAGLVLLPAAAVAGNGVHPRTPVLWEWTDQVAEPGGTPQDAGDGRPPCITVVDRSSAAELELAYRIPFEDTNVTPDEVDDSRRHQFVAFRATGRALDDPTPFECPIIGPQDPPPNWLSSADVRAAADKGLVGPVGADHKTPDPAKPCCGIESQEVVGSHPGWTDCWTRITGDDERRPITFAESAKPVVWDTTGIPVGTYLVFGYTWEPVFNMWRRRPGVVKVVDGPDPANAPPALALSVTPDAEGNQDPLYYSDSKPSFDVCIDALDGSTVTLSWASTDPDPVWSPLLSDAPVVSGDNQLSFELPPELAGKSFILRADVTDPSDRTFTTFLDELVVVLPGMDPDMCTDLGGGGFIGDPTCGGSSGEPADAGPLPFAAPDLPQAAAPGTVGCGACSAAGHGAPTPLAALVLLLAARRRRS